MTDAPSTPTQPTTEATECPDAPHIDRHRAVVAAWPTTSSVEALAPLQPLAPPVALPRQLFGRVGAMSVGARQVRAALDLPTSGRGRGGAWL